MNNGRGVTIPIYHYNLELQLLPTSTSPSTWTTIFVSVVSVDSGEVVMIKLVQSNGTVVKLKKV